jgi:hypothetical protein
MDALSVNHDDDGVSGVAVLKVKRRSSEKDTHDVKNIERDRLPLDEYCIS